MVKDCQGDDGGAFLLSSSYWSDRDSEWEGKEGM